MWRLCSAEYTSTAFDGEGARLFGGRWSPRGVRVVYTSESRALAVLEVLANADETDDFTVLRWAMIPAEIPVALIENPCRLPETWRNFPHTAEGQEFGAAWARERRSAALRVPSAVVPGELNYLLNPAHPDFKHIEIGPPEAFTFDVRLR